MREVLPARSWRVFVTMLLGIGAIVGVLMPWAHGLELSRGGVSRGSFYGFEYVQGVIALVGALSLTIVSALRASRRIGDIEYVLLGAVACVISFGASIWFWSSEVNALDPINAYVDLFRPVRIEAGVGLYLTGSSALTSLLCLVGFPVGGPLRSGVRIVHDERTLDGGSIVPD